VSFFVQAKGAVERPSELHPSPFAGLLALLHPSRTHARALALQASSNFGLLPIEGSEEQVRGWESSTTSLVEGGLRKDVEIERDECKGERRGWVESCCCRDLNMLI
jgi:hypothetical protein